MLFVSAFVDCAFFILCVGCLTVDCVWIVGAVLVLRFGRVCLHASVG